LPRKEGWKDRSDEFWEFARTVLPKPKKKSKKGGRPQADFRRILNGILSVRRTGYQWKLLPPEYCPGSTTHRYFQNRVKAGVFEKLWKKSLHRYDEIKGIDWRWQALDSQRISSAVQGAIRSGKTLRIAGNEERNGIASSSATVFLLPQFFRQRMLEIAEHIMRHGLQS
jgi:transposase